ncbi:MAG: two-component system cell cycle sensor histidine kinase/response regulator CckA [Planctomycetota bacterium]|jgi:two-component system cell cycle sensor histidine kinase/response regulator CckA
MLVSADPSQLRQVVMNLITNAAETVGGQEGRSWFAPDSGFSPVRAGTLSWGAEFEPGECLCLNVIDSGIGMSSNLQAPGQDLGSSLHDQDVRA